MTLEQLNDIANGRVKQRIGSYGTRPGGLAADVVGEYRRAERAIEDELAKAYARLENVSPEDYYNELIKYQRLERLQRQIREITRTGTRRADRILIESSNLAISNKFYLDQYAINWFGPESGAAQFFVPLPTEVINVSVFGTPEVWEGIAERARERLRLSAYQPKHGTLTEVLLRNDQQTAAAIRQTITQGFIQGKSFTQMTKDLRGVFNTTAANAMRISRTEGTRNMNSGAFAATQTARAAGVDVKRKIRATLDTRTRQQSAEVDGRSEDDEGRFTYPGGVKVEIPGNSGVAEWDVNDRETVIDVIDGIDPGLRRGRDPATGETKIANYASFEDWMKEHNLRFNASGRIIHSSQVTDSRGRTVRRPRRSAA